MRTTASRAKTKKWSDIKNETMSVSTLRRYIQAMGGDLDIIARFPDGEFHIDVFQDIDHLPKGARR